MSSIFLLVDQIAERLLRQKLGSYFKTVNYTNKNFHILVNHSFEFFTIKPKFPLRTSTFHKYSLSKVTTCSKISRVFVLRMIYKLLYPLFYRRRARRCRAGSTQNIRARSFIGSSEWAVENVYGRVQRVRSSRQNWSRIFQRRDDSSC